LKVKVVFWNVKSKTQILKLGEVALKTRFRIC